MPLTTRSATLCLAAALLAGPALAGPLPTRIGACTVTAIDVVASRLVDSTTNQPVPGSGSSVGFVNGGYQVSYDVVPAIVASHKGDPVRMCLVSVPTHCPKGDNRGKIYRTTNLRTHKSWQLPDSEHSCGGA